MILKIIKTFLKPFYKENIYDFFSLIIYIYIYIYIYVCVCVCVCYFINRCPFSLDVTMFRERIFPTYDQTRPPNNTFCKEQIFSCKYMFIFSPFCSKIKKTYERMTVKKKKIIEKRKQRNETQLLFEINFIHLLPLSHRESKQSKLNAWQKKNKIWINIMVIS